MNNRYTYDKRADAIYIKLSDEPIAYTEALDDERIIDYDAKGNPVGVELLCVSDGVITEGLPALNEIIHILESEQVKIFA